MRRLIAITVTALLLLTAFCGCEKEIDKSKYALYSDNFSISQNMMSYFFNIEYINFLATNQDILTELDLDTSSSLSSQKCKFNSTNWYDYFMASATKKAEQYLVIEEYYKQNNKEMGKDANEFYENTLASLKEVAENKGKSFKEYVSETFGEDVKESTVEECLRLEALAHEYYEKYSASLNITDKVLEDCYNSNKTSFARVSYLYMQIESEEMSTANDSGYDIAFSLKSAKNEKEFLKICKDYYYKFYLNKYGKKHKKEALAQTEQSLKQVKVKNVAYFKGDSISKWAFANGRQKGDTLLNKDSKSGYYTVCYLLSAPKRESYFRVNFKQILFSNESKATAQKVYKSLKKANFNQKLFAKNAKKYSIDDGTKATGGKYKNVKIGSLKDAQELDDWLFDKARKAGDHTLLKTASHGYHIVYFESVGEQAWKDDVKNLYKSDEFNRHLEEIADNFVITVNNNIIYKIKETEQ